MKNWTIKISFSLLVCLGIWSILQIISCKKESDLSSTFQGKYSGFWRISLKGDLCSTFTIQVGSEPGELDQIELPLVYEYDNRLFRLVPRIDENGTFEIEVYQNNNFRGTIAGALSTQNSGSGNYEILFDPIKRTGAWSAIKVDSPCAGLNCGPNAICIDGHCECQGGYEGCDCQVLGKQKFIGNYTATENCTIAGTFTYNLNIENGTDAYTLKIPNMGDFGTNYFVQAQVEKQKPSDLIYTRIYIPKQNPQGMGISFEGSGIIDGNTISGMYVNEFPDGSLEYCSFQYKKN